ncbi:MAG TPA: spore germination protein [Bacillota bacterium]|nr:spore germination protein [Bacillota bacterium]
MAQILIGSFKINCIHSGAVLNIGDVIFSLPCNKIQLSAGDGSFGSGDGAIPPPGKERRSLDGGGRNGFSKP